MVKTKRFIKRDGTVVSREFVSASTQTWLPEIERAGQAESDNGGDGGDEGDAEDDDENGGFVNGDLEESYAKATIKSCPVCLEDFSDSKSMLLSHCSHVICGSCLGRLDFTSSSLRATVKCPTCRQVCKRHDFVKVVFPSCGTLMSDERKTLTDTFKLLRRKEIPDIIAQLTYILDLEVQRSSELTLPPTVNRLMLERYTRIYSGALTSVMLRKHVNKLVRKVNALDRLIIKVLKYIRVPSENLIYDASNYIAKLIVQNLKRKKQLCDVCSPRPT